MEYFYYNGIGTNDSCQLFTMSELKRLIIKNNHLFNPPFVKPYLVTPQDIGAINVTAAPKSTSMTNSSEIK